MNGMNISGINEQEIEKTIQTLKKYLEELKKRLDQLDLVVDSTNRFYLSSSANSYRQKYRELSANYEIVKKNIMGYIDDLSTVIANYRNFASDASAEINTIQVGD